MEKENKTLGTEGCENFDSLYINKIIIIIILKIKSVVYSSQGSHTGQLDFCNWLADNSTTG